MKPRCHCRQAVGFLAGMWLSGTVLVGCQPAAENRLIIGMELEYPPFEMTDERGRPAGISVDLAAALGEALDRPVTIENLPFDGLIPALKTGKIHLIISSMTATPERAASIDFSDPYVKTGICLLIHRDSPVHAVGDLNVTNVTLAVKKGTTGHLYAVEHLPQARLLVLDKDASCALEVSQGKADAFIYDQLSIYQNWQRHPQTTRPNFTPIRTEYWAIGLRKGDQELRSQVNRFLAEFRAGHGFARLGERYLDAQRETFQEMGVDFIF